MEHLPALAAAAASVVVATFVGSAPASAGKDVFEREKPHVSYNPPVRRTPVKRNAAPPRFAPRRNGSAAAATVKPRIIDRPPGSYRKVGSGRRK